MSAFLRAILSSCLFSGTIFAQPPDKMTLASSQLPTHVRFRLGTTAFRPGGEPKCMLHSPVEGLLAFLLRREPSRVSIIDSRTGLPVRQTEYKPFPASSLAFSPDGTVLAIGTSDGKIAFWDPRSDRTTQFIDTQRDVPIAGVCFSPDNKLLAFASYEHSIEVWNLSERKRTALVREKMPVKSLSVLENEAGILTSYQSRHLVTLWEWASGKSPRQLDASYSIAAAAPDGKSIALRDKSSTVAVYDVLTFRHLRSLQETCGPLTAIQYVTASLIATGTSSGELAIWDLNAGQRRRMVKAHPSRIAGLAVSSDRTKIYTSGEDGTIRIWDIETLERVPPRNLEDHENRVHGIRCTQDCKHLVSASDDVLRIWDLRTGKLIRGIRTPVDGNTAVAISPNEQNIAAVGADHHVRIFQSSTGTETSALDVNPSSMASELRIVSDWPYSESLDYSSDGKRLAAVAREGHYGDQYVGIWDAASGRLSRHVKLFRSGGLIDSPSCLKYSSDGKHLAIAGRYGVYVLDSESDKEIYRRQFERDTYPSARLGLSMDGKLLACASKENDDWDWQMELLDIRSECERSHRIDASLGDPVSLKFTQDSAYLVGAFERGLCFWDTDDSRLHKTIAWRDAPLSCLEISRDGNWLITGSVDTSILVWDLKVMLVKP